MWPDSKDAAYLWDMLDAARAIQKFVFAHSVEAYRAHRMLRGAVERHIEIIGEAANRVSRGLRSAHPEIPWQRIISQRNVLSHEYGEIDDGLTWRVATEHIPELISQLERIMPPLPPEET